MYCPVHVSSSYLEERAFTEGVMADVQVAPRGALGALSCRLAFWDRSAGLAARRKGLNVMSSHCPKLKV